MKRIMTAVLIVGLIAVAVSCAPEAPEGTPPPKETVAPAPAPESAAPDAKAKELEDAFWARIRKNADTRLEAGDKDGAKKAYENYLSESPDGAYAEEAKKKIAELETK